MQTLTLAGTFETLKLERDPAAVTGFSVAVGRLSWQTCFESFAQQSDLTRICIRRAAGMILARRNAGGEVGSSDISHEIFAAYRRNDGQWPEVILELVNEVSPV
jgi:hypothetical protein